MIAWFTLAALLPAATGFLLCSAFWRRSQGLAAGLSRLFIGLGMGAGLSSCTLYFGLLIGYHDRSSLLLFDSLCLAIAGTVWWAMRRCQSADEIPAIRMASPRASVIGYLLTIPVVAAICIAFRYSIGYAAAHPHGAWDGWAIWTMRARFLFRSGGRWRDAFSPILAYSHPDYPILLPATISRLWTYLQNEAVLVPTMLGFFFMLCTLGLAMSSVALLRDQSQALLTGGVLVTTPFFVRHAVSGYADVPLTFFFLATTVLLLMSDSAPQMFVLAGLTASLAAWTKNEGLLFLLSSGVAVTVQLFVTRGHNAKFRALSLFVAGASPVLALIILFKAQLQGRDWLFESSLNGESILGRLTDFGRYSLISKSYFREIPQFGEWKISMVLVLLAYFLLLGRLRCLKQKPGLLTAIGALAITFAGYFLVYVITPAELGWQLNNSLNRILLQLWPSAVVVFFCVTRTPEEVLAVPTQCKTEIAGATS